MSKKRKILLLGGLLAAACCAIPSHGSERDELPKIAQTMEEQHAASPRVICGNGGSGYSAGTGTTIGKTRDEYVVASNAHVVEGSNSITCQYFGAGKPVNVEARFDRMLYKDGEDFAIVGIPRAALESYDPPIVPIAPMTRAAIVAGEPIESVGCPKAREPMAWKGRVLGDFGKIRTFKPAPEQGQSGSGIAQWNGDYLELRSILCYQMDGDNAPQEELDFDRNLGGALDFRNFYEGLGLRAGSRPTFRRVAATVDNTNVVPVVASVPVVGRVGGYSIRPAVARLTVDEVREMGVPVPDIPRPEPKTEQPKPKLQAPPLVAPTVHRAILYFTFVGCKYCAPLEPVVAELKQAGHDIRRVDITTPSGEALCQNYGVARKAPQFVAVEFDGPGANARRLRVVGKISGYVAPDLLRREAVDFFNAPPRVVGAAATRQPAIRSVAYHVDDLPSVPVDSEDVLPAPEADAILTELAGERVEAAEELPRNVDELLKQQASGVVAGWYNKRAPAAPAPSGPKCDPNDPACNGNGQTGLIGDAVAERLEAALRERLEAVESEIRSKIEAELADVGNAIDEKIAAVGGEIDGKIQSLTAMVRDKIEAVFEDVAQAAVRCVWLAAASVLGGFFWGRFGRRLKITWLSESEKNENQTGI
ncbi:MAG: hypothetical protein IKU86_03280 [Thermoguttaceae bacterium]|nr:hypothetical protein [Thermoguttaceae bacterium]